MSTLLGITLNGRYRLEARIGAGGMSTVYRATDETLQRQVAVKLMHREIATDSDQLERFRREARAVAQLSHPHIVGVIDYGEDLDPAHPRPYIVFEYVEGETLKERIRRTGRLPITEAVAYAIEIARALGTAHAHHIVHRDVKPQNVLIDEEGSAKVTDFGIARTLDEEGLTVDGRVLGTTDYVSPEQALGRPVTGQSDLYSLGIVLYEMLTGEVPFKGENQVAVAMKHVREQIPDVQYVRPEVSAALASVVDTATAKRVEDRYADDAELIADLEDVLAIETARAGSATGEVTSVLRTLPSETQRRVPYRVLHRAGALALTLVLLAIVTGVVVWLGTRTHQQAPKLQAPAPAPHEALIRPCPTCAHDYNPDAISGAKVQNPGLDGYAIDGDTHTAWLTEHYYNGSLQKAGVGLYVDLGQPTHARYIDVYTQTPGWSGQIWASSSPPDPAAFVTGPGGWVQLAQVASMQNGQKIPLTGGYRYYLVWITSLPPGKDYAALNEVALYQLTR
jgi:tRNA A-37 threonylcarbamoyl transferase component Bud32